PVGWSMPWWFWNLLGDLAVFVLSRLTRLRG
ncbi:MAG: methionine biosynthesis protein MetW, partial [Hyphomicrobiales bacterium]